jgi:hypothetical protein
MALSAGAAAGVMNDRQVEAGHHLEQLAGNMRRAAVAGRRHLDRARTRLRVGDELRGARHRHRRVHHHDQGFSGDARDRRDVAQEVEAEIGIERGADRVGRTDEQKRVTVGRRPHDRFGGDIAGAARPVLDHERLAEPPR